VVYGDKFCYVNADEPMRTMRTIIEEQGPNVVRIEATHCMDMIASEAEREKIAQELAGGEKVWWMVPGHSGGAIVLDAIGYIDRYRW